MPENYTIQIPFCGFYESWADHVLEKFLDTNKEDFEQGITDYYIDHDKVNWKDVHEKYAKLYVEQFEQYLLNEEGLDTKLTFSELYSPRFYNYETDKIYAFISREDFTKALSHVDSDNVNAWIKSRFESRSGFASFYDGDIDHSKWEGNEDHPSLLGCYLEALDSVDQDNHEYPVHLMIMEYAEGNGLINELFED